MNTPALKTIYLHGRMGKKFGKVWELAVDSPAEAIRAIECMTGKMYKYLLDGDKRGVAYNVVIGKENLTNVAELGHSFGEDVKEFHFYPVPRGSGGGLLAIIGAIIFIAAVFFTGGAALGALSASSSFGATMAAGMGALGTAGFGMGTFFAMMGASLMIQGISQMIMGTPKLSTVAQQETNPSYGFSGPTNTSRQGGPIPLGYGRMIVGSQVISLAVRTTRIGNDNGNSTYTGSQWNGTGFGGGGGTYGSPHDTDIELN